MRKVLSLLTMLMLTATFAMAQQRDVTGRVVRDNGDPAPFASVTVKGSRTGVSADENGTFTIKAKTGDVLVISFQKNEKEVTVNSAQLGDIAFAKRTKGSDKDVTVVATGLGGVRQAEQLGVSTAKVKASELTQAKVVNLQNGLTGKVSGLNVQSVNNGVFGETRITLRGIRSLTGNNQPMLILDGVPISLSFISSLNPNDILDVNILKSSSATAIYGPDGVNGAIVITTKKGTKGKPTVTVSNTLQLERVSFLPKLQNQFGSGSSVDIYGYGVYDPIENQTYGDAFDGSLRQIGRVGPPGTPYAAGQTAIYKALPGEKLKFFNTGITNQTDVSYSTGDFYLSAQNVLVKGTVPKDENKRISVRMTANKEYNRFKAAFNINYTQQKYNIHAGNQFGNGRDDNFYWNLINTPPQIEVTKYKDWKNDYWSSPNGYHNPYWKIDNYRQVGRSDDLLGSVQLDYKLSSWLNLTYRLGYTHSTSNSKSTQGQYNYSDFAHNSGKSNAQSNVVAAVNDNSAFSNRVTSEMFATAKKTFGNITIDGLVGQSFREINSQALFIGTTAVGIPDVLNPIARLGEVTPGVSNTQQRLERYFGKVGFGYKSFLFVEATGSYDIDSRLVNPYNYNKKDISFFYPGASASLVLTEAISALKDNKILSFAKLRGAVSKTGNVNLGTYQLENTYGTGTDFPYGGLLGFTANNTIRRTSYKPEFVINKEVGIELGFLDNKINFEATAYTQDNSDQIITVQYSATTGFPQALLNAAAFTNKGLELDLKLTPLIQINKNFKIDFKINYTRQENVVTKLIDGVDELGIGNGNFIIKGESAYTFKLTDYVRDDQGRVIVSRITGLPTVDPVAKKFGQTIPKDILGLNLNVSYKNFSLSAVADYRGGNQIFSGIGSDLDFAGLSERSAQNNRQPFVLPNSSYFDGSKYVANTNVYIRSAYDFWSTASNTNANSNYLTSGAFWKLRELALTYNFPDRMFNNKAVKGISVSFSGRNLFTWLPKTNEWTDPEFSNTTGNATGVNDRNQGAPTRIMGANVIFKF
jgi:TonB-linked SusC/RagA family outer membrane protein